MTIKQQCENRIRELVPELQAKEWRVIDNVAIGTNHYKYEIHLEHILMAIEKVKENNPIAKGRIIKIDNKGELNDIAIYSSGEIVGTYYRPEDDTTFSGLFMDYDLSKSFSDQSEEFYSFLYNIIK